MHKPISTYFLIFVFTFCLSMNISTNVYSSQDKNSSSSNLKLQSLLIHLIKNHEELKSLDSRVEQAKAQYSQSKGLYYPSIDLSADGGREKIDKEFSSDTNENRYNVTLRASQLITDFGKTTNTIKRSGVLLDQARASLESSRQQLMFEGIKAYINISIMRKI